MPTDPTPTQNPALHRRLSEPCTQEDAESRVARFFELLAAARAECGVPDVVVVTSVNIQTDDGESQTIGVHGLGDSSRLVPMLSQALRSVAVQQMADIARMAGMRVPGQDKRS